LIPETSFETLRSEDSLAKRVDACGAEKPTISRTPFAVARLKVKSVHGCISASFIWSCVKYRNEWDKAR
jgi:hypothetical protein